MSDEKSFRSVHKNEIVIFLITLPLLTALVLFFVVLPWLLNSSQPFCGKTVSPVPSNAEQKLANPIDMTLVFLKTPQKPGDAGEVMITVSPQMDAPEMNISLDIPKNFSPKGTLEWTGDMKKGETKVLSASFALPDDKDYEIKGSAWVKGIKTAKVCNGKILSLGSNKSKPAPPKGEEKFNNKGKKIIEFDVPKNK